MVKGGVLVPTPAEWREESRLYRQIAKTEATPHLKQRVFRHALALAELAERIEREEAAGASLEDAAS
jgi:hypothetical protein